MTARRTIVFAGLALVTFACSLAGFTQLVLWIAVLSACRLATRRPGTPGVLVRSALALAPALGLSAWFWAAQPAAVREYPTWRYAAGNVLRLDVVRTLGTPLEAVAGSTLAAVLWGAMLASLAIAWRDRRAAGWPFLVLLAVGVAYAFFAPASVLGASLLTPRQVYFVVFAAALWMAARHTRRSHLLLAGTCAVATAVLVAARWPLYAQYDTAMRRFVDDVSGADFGSARTLLSVPARAQPQIDPSGRSAVVLSGAAAGYVATLRQLVWLDDYELRTTHFPLRTRERHEAHGPVQFVSAPGSRIDALLTWNGDARARDALAGRLMAAPDVMLSRIQFPTVAGTPTLFLRRSASETGRGAPAAR
jgi:hypothetical protein